MRVSMERCWSMVTIRLLDKKSGSSISYHLRISSTFLTDELP
nr:MAG TPA: hypothetical protein [Caudoviricetes sp.]DAX27271.1 MAG TPA: hypothetical protein [Caudoviricetes sp.]DAX94513.1 MAG TPA: hypothetical protein [Caudoviricetes sp.]